MAVSIIVEHIEIQVSVQPCKLIEKNFWSEICLTLKTTTLKISDYTVYNYFM